MNTVKATLTYSLEYEEDEIESDPRELLLEILASESDSILIDYITVERTTTL